MSADEPAVDTEHRPISTEGLLMTHFLAVRDVRRARAFYEASSRVSSGMSLRVADIEASYREWLVRGAHFLTAPLDQRAGIRCSMRDPDGYRIEVGQATGLVEGRPSEEAPAGGEAGGADGR
jgi:predicted enzyme related to lactoylglutathione lyase